MSSINNVCNTCYPIGISVPIVNSDNGYFQQTFDTNSRVKQNLVNFLNTKRGERRMQPTFGTRLRELTFEQNDTNTQEIAKSILTQEFATWVPEVVIDSISINNTGNPNNVDNYKLIVSILYTVKQTKEQQLVSLELEKNT